MSMAHAHIGNNIATVLGGTLSGCELVMDRDRKTSFGIAIMILKTFSAEYGIKSFSKSCDAGKKVMSGEPPVARRTAATFSSK